MAFPTIPTVAASRILALNQANTTATRTFPNLSGLTKNAGDLLIAIVCGYQTGTGTNAAFSGWSAGWTEFHDSASSTTMAIGMAYKWSTGSETGAISVTQAGTITGHASMMLLSIPGAHATTPPEAGSRASGTGASNPASFDPSGWAAEDTLWIAVGASGEDAITGTWTGMGSAPTNYSGYADTAAPDSSVVGQTELAVAFRQLNASAEDVAAFTGNDTSNARDAAVVIAVRPKPPTSTSVAEISLASHGVPSERTNHSLKIRARTTSGSTGVIKAALYEGATNRSGDLTSSVLTTSLADYTLVIPDASAANITDYSNLSIRFWGYDDAGNALVFEVANVYLQLPASTVVPPKSTPVARISLASHGTPSERTNHSIKIRARTTAGSTGVIKAALYEGATNRSGDLTSGLLTNSLADYTLVISDAAAATITSYSDLEIRLWGYDDAGNALVFEVADLKLQLPTAAGGATTYYGVTSSSITFGEVVVGSRKTFGQVATPFTFSKDIAARRKTFGQIAAPFTFNKDVQGVRKTLSQIAFPVTFGKDVKGIRAALTLFGQVAAPFTFGKDVKGLRKAISQLALPITFGKDVKGIRVAQTHFGQVALPVTFTKDVKGVRLAQTYFGQVALPVTFGKDVKGYRPGLTYFGQVALPATFVKDVKGVRKTFSSTATPLVFGKDVSGRRKTSSSIVLPVTFSATTNGIKTAKTVYGVVALPITVSKDVNAVRKAFGQTATTIVFGKDVNATRKTFGQTLSPFIFGKAVAGQRKTFSSSVMPITVGISTAGVRLGITRFGAVAFPITFGKDVRGVRKTFSQTATFLVFGKNVGGVRKTFGTIALPIIFGEIVGGKQTVYAQLSMQTLFGKEVAARRRTFSSSALPIIFSKAVAGRKQTFGRVALPINATIVVNGFISAHKYYGASSMSIVFNKDIRGVRKTFGSTVSPFIFGKSVQAQRQVIGVITFPINFFVDVKSGPRRTHGQISLPILFTAHTESRIITVGIILNEADTIYLGTIPVTAVYTEDQLVWSLT